LKAAAGLRARDGSWGVRDLEAVADYGTGKGFEGPEIIEMPANNLSLVFRRSAKTVDRRGASMPIGALSL
jgi:hypothetical protein